MEYVHKLGTRAEPSNQLVSILLYYAFFVVALVNGSSRRRSYVSRYFYYFAAGLHVYILTLVLQDVESHY